MTAPVVTVEQVTAGVTYPLRGTTLRVGRSVEIPGDDDPGTIHLAARTAVGQVVGVVRFHPAACPWRAAEHPWQLRGMATDPAIRGRGVGRALIVVVLARVTGLGGDLVWCDARATAVGFYERAGFTAVTEQFELPTIGPHVGMIRASAR